MLNDAGPDRRRVHGRPHRRGRRVLPVRLAAGRGPPLALVPPPPAGRRRASGSRSSASALIGLSVAGPRSRDVLAAVAPDLDLSTEAFPFMSFRRVDLGHDPGPARRGSTTRATSATSCGSRPSTSARCSTAIVAAGEPHGMRLFGMRALMSLRLEKSYGTWFREYRPIYTPLEAGITRYLQLDHDFIGRAAHEAELAAGGPKRRLVTLRRRARPRRPGRRHRRRADLARRRGRRLGHLRRLRAPRQARRSRSATCRPSWPTPDGPGGQGFEIEIIGRRRPARLQPEPLFDPQGLRMRQ